MTSGSKYKYGIEFNGHRSNEFGIDVADGKQVGFPSKSKLQVTPLASNSVIDLSYLYGPAFGERTLKLTFVIVDRRYWTKESMYIQWTKVINWLMGTRGKVPLHDDIMHDYHYLAEVQEAPDFEELRLLGRMSVVFQCYPFRIYDRPEFDDIWDTFNFELDVANKVDYTVAGSLSHVIVSVGVADVEFTVTVSADMQLELYGQTFQLKAGENTSPELAWSPGETTFKLTGNGTAHFEWYREVI